VDGGQRPDFGPASRCLKTLALALGFVRAAWAAEPAEVEVHGDPIAAAPRERSVAGSTIRGERLRSPGLQASDVLRTQPGIAVLETGGYGSLSTASIRGATAAQTPVYLAGIRLNDDVGGTADLSLVPLWLLYEVEIYRSNAPLAGDQLGLGGAIFFEPRRAKKTEAGVGAMAGSFGARAAWLRAGVGGEDASALVAARVDGARNDYPFIDDGGTRFDRSNERTVVRTNADARTDDLWALATVRLGDRARADIVANEVDREQGLPGLTLFPSVRARARLTRRIAGLTTRVACPDRRCEVVATASAIASRTSFDDPLREVALGATRLDFDATRVESGIVVRWAPTETFSVTPAARASIERMTTDAANVSSAHAARGFARAAVQTEWITTDVVTLRALGSVECNGTSVSGVPPWMMPGDAAGPQGPGHACDELMPAARAGAQIDGGGFSLLANIGRYARVPTLTELYGSSGAVRGNVALVPENGVSTEAGIRSAIAWRGTRRISIDLFAFARTARDLIAYQRSSIGWVRPFNVGAARVVGAEVFLDVRPVSFAAFQIAATLLDPRNTSQGRPTSNDLPYEPRLTLVPRVEVGSRVALAPVESAKLALSYFYESSRYADPAGLVVIPEQGSLDVDADVVGFGGTITLRGRLANALDQTRFDLIGYPLPGRAAYAALEAQW
jgi:vitamin B12 transporter